MRTLPLLEKPDGILAFDFDGTMHSPEQRPPIDGRLLGFIENLRESEGMIWGICTGRALMHLVEGFADGLRFLPDFVVAREREIYFPNEFGRFVADVAWNKACDKEHKRLFKKVRKELKAVRKYVEGTAKGEWVEVEGDLAGVVLPSEEEMPGLLSEIERLCGGYPSLGYERNGIYLRFSHSSYGKGSALKEVARRLNVGPEGVIAGGDNFNDLSMFAPDVTLRPICPGNAVAEVKRRVAECGGVVGESIAGAGLAEALGQIFGEKK